MSRRSRRGIESRRKPATLEARPPRGRGPARWSPRAWFVAAVALLLVGGAVFVFRRPRGDGTHAESAAAIALRNMDATQATGRGVKLGRMGRHTESLPYFRRGAEADGGALAHFNYAAALNNAAFEVGSRNGVPFPASRSSIERFALMREAFAELRLAERQAPDPRTLALFQLVRGRALMQWGFPLDALALFRSALVLDSASAATRREIAAYESALRAGSFPGR